MWMWTSTLNPPKNNISLEQMWKRNWELLFFQASTKVVQICWLLLLMTEQCERKHGSIPAELWSFMWTTTLLQVWDGAKWRKMMSSQAGRTLSPSSCSAVWSTTRVTLSTHLQQSYSTPKPNSQNIWGREDEWWGQYDRAAFSHLYTVSLKHLTFISEKWSEMPHEETNAWVKCWVHSLLGTATALFTIIFACRDSS